MSELFSKKGCLSVLVPTMEGEVEVEVCVGSGRGKTGVKRNKKDGGSGVMSHDQTCPSLHRLNRCEHLSVSKNHKNFSLNRKLQYIMA